MNICYPLGFVLFASLVNMPDNGISEPRIDELENCVELMRNNGVTPSPGIRMVLNDTSNDELQLMILSNACLGNNYTSIMQVLELQWMKCEIPSVRVLILLVCYSHGKSGLSIFPNFRKLSGRYTEAEAAQRLSEVEWVEEHYEEYSDLIINVCALSSRSRAIPESQT